MKVLQTTEVRLEWADLANLTYHARNSAARSTGNVHVSDVLRRVTRKLKLYTDEDREDDMPLRILLGLAFEESAARLYSGMWWQPGEFVLDDGIGCAVVGSPDGIEELPCFQYDPNNPTEWYVHEFKYTGKSMRVKGGKADQLKDIRTEWFWMHQGMSYVNMLRARGLKSSRCWFHICWKFGVYGEWPQTERYYKYLVEFDDRDLEGNLIMLNTHKDDVGIEVREG